MPNYQNSKIYTIRNYDDNDMIYVGSTTEALSKRFYKHKQASIRHPNWKLYQTVNNDWNNWYIELYELFPCNSKMELEKREGEVQRLIGTLNMCIAGRTGKQYYQDNADRIKEQRKEYRKDNKERIKEINKQYRQQNKEYIYKKTECPCGGIYTHHHKSEHLKSKLHQDYELNITGTITDTN